MSMQTKYSEPTRRAFLDSPKTSQVYKCSNYCHRESHQVIFTWLIPKTLEGSSVKIEYPRCQPLFTYYIGPYPLIDGRWMRIGTDGFPLTRYQLVNCEESAFQTKIILKYGKRDGYHYQSPVANHQPEITHTGVCTNKLGRNHVSSTIGCACLNVRENSTELLSNRRGVEQDGGLKTKIFSIRYHCYKTFRCKILRAYLE